MTPAIGKDKRSTGSGSLCNGYRKNGDAGARMVLALGGPAINRRNGPGHIIKLNFTRISLSRTRTRWSNVLSIMGEWRAGGWRAKMLHSADPHPPPCAPASHFDHPSEELGTYISLVVPRRTFYGTLAASRFAGIPIPAEAEDKEDEEASVHAPSSSVY